MDQAMISPDVLEKTNCGAFVVENGIVTYANQAALSHQVSIGAAIADYICVGADEYADFTKGKLCLTLNLYGASVNATVVDNGKVHIFYLESDYEEPELRAFALAAQHLREPLANAMTCTNRLHPDIASQGSPEVQEQLAQLNKNLHRLHRAICNMSDAAQYQSPRPSRFEYREIGSIFNEVMEKASCHLSIADRKLTYSGLNETVNTMVDAEKLERALLNMLSNTVKFSPKDSTIRANLRKSGNKLYFSLENAFEDTANSNCSNIFNSFLREPGIESPQNGIGLGMTLVQKTAAAHGGTLLLQHSAEFGIRLTMTIPIETAKTAKLRSNIRLPIDYAGGFDHTLTELSDVLPAKLYD